MSEIPEDVMVAATKAYDDGFERFAGNKIEAIAQAILAEREACAKIAEEQGRNNIDWVYAAACLDVSQAIRRR